MGTPSAMELATELELLEADVKDKLLGLDTSSWTIHPRSREERVLRSGPFRAHPVRIFAPHRLHRTRRFGLTVDRAAHLLSALPLDLSVMLAGRVREVALLPDFVQHRSSLLTHVFLPGRNMLAFYLFPARLLETPADTYPERFRQGQASSAGMLPALIRTIARVETGREAPSAPAATPGSQRLLKFLVPRDLILPGEAEAMQEIHDQYRRPTL